MRAIAAHKRPVFRSRCNMLPYNLTQSAGHNSESRTTLKPKMKRIELDMTDRNTRRNRYNAIHLIHLLSLHSSSILASLACLRPLLKPTFYISD